MKWTFLWDCCSTAKIYRNTFPERVKSERHAVWQWVTRYANILCQPQNKRWKPKLNCVAIGNVMLRITSIKNLRTNERTKTHFNTRWSQLVWYWSPFAAADVVVWLSADFSSSKTFQATIIAYFQTVWYSKHLTHKMKTRRRNFSVSGWSAVNVLCCYCFFSSSVSRHACASECVFLHIYFSNCCFFNSTSRSQFYSD